MKKKKKHFQNKDIFWVTNTEIFQSEKKNKLKIKKKTHCQPAFERPKRVTRFFRTNDPKRHNGHAKKMTSKKTIFKQPTPASTASRGKIQTMSNNKYSPENTSQGKEKVKIINKNRPIYA